MARPATDGAARPAASRSVTGTLVSFRTSFMWQIGHSPGLSDTTWGCMGQRHAAPVV